MRVPWIVASGLVAVACTFPEKTLVDPDAAPTVHLAVERSGPGRVRSSPIGIDCGPVCAADFSVPDVVLTPTLEVPGQLLAWGRDCAGAGATCTVHLDTDRTATASFCGFGAWDTDLVPDVTMFSSLRFPALAVLADGTVVTAYYNSDLADYRLMRRDLAGTWIDNGGVADGGIDLSLAVDPTTDALHAIYRRLSIPGLFYRSRQPDGTWAPEETIDASYMSDLQGDLAVDAGGGVHISYAEPGASRARYGYRAPGGGWLTFSLEAELEGVRHTSIAVDAPGNVYLTYSTTRGVDADDAVVLVSKGPAIPGTWTKVDIDTGRQVGQYTAIAVGSAGDLHVSYYDGSFDDLLYATRPAGSAIWTRTTVDPDADDVGAFSQIGLDGSGGVHISYIDLTNADLLHAYKPSDGPWSLSTIESSGTIDSRHSLVVGPSGVHVAYRNAGLRYGRLACTA